ncbi:hypothetical protein [Actinoallomurus acaciae]|uniref:Uncharacterized protein n=1 Tax=Actinoallomurus acaciae TaxID=502577 RepID=A0ABV5YJ61_9ACTN
MAFLSKGRDELAKVTAPVVAIVMAIGLGNGGPRFQFTEKYWWIEQFGVHYAVGAHTQNTRHGPDGVRSPPTAPTTTPAAAPEPHRRRQTLTPRAPGARWSGRSGVVADAVSR